MFHVSFSKGGAPDAWIFYVPIIVNSFLISKVLMFLCFNCNGACSSEFLSNGCEWTQAAEGLLEIFHWKSRLSDRSE